eukprot:TRINITY_DN7219_c0_g3_i2.p1 TRINITY_DN7219_c0_g3~~TRINITY_DN7219_c0_g3_i2.p1  ORF type:complete len:200 (-),score=20.69 TRINITY_DN7219_c0_g3_i2:163-762(-)
MIMLAGGRYPVYPSLPYGFYSHVEPVLGVLSNNPLSEDWSPDDVLVHGTDASGHSYYRTFASLPAGITASNVSKCGEDYLGYPCIYAQYGFGWAVTGLQDPTAGSIDVSLDVDSNTEPDTRSGQSPGALQGTVTVSKLKPGEQYDLYRWDDVESAFDYAKATKVHSFVADAEPTVFTDPTSITSNGVTYYRCLPKKTQK